MIFEALAKRKPRWESDIVEILRRIDTKKREENLPLLYGETIRIAFVLVGRSEIVSHYGAKPYVERVKFLVKQNNVNRIYILAKKTRNIEVAQEVVRQTRGLFRSADRFPSNPSEKIGICFCLER